MQYLPEVKRGDTFSYTAIWEGATLSELRSQVRDGADRLISDVVIAATEDTDTFSFTVLDTTDWPISELFTDIERTSAGTKKSSETMIIPVIKDVTR